MEERAGPRCLHDRPGPAAGHPTDNSRRPYTVEANVADTPAVIDRLAGGMAWIVGHSWGGHLALHVLVRHPERVQGAIIIDPLGADMGILPEFGEKLNRAMPADELRRVEEIEGREEDGVATLEESLECLRLRPPRRSGRSSTTPCGSPSGGRA